MFSIVKYPAKILRTRSQRVSNILSDEIQRFIKELGETMLQADGLGLAANQVDQDLRILAVNYQGQPKAFINPVIYFKSFKKEIGEEGCLSFPGVFGLLKRSLAICLFYQDENGRWRHLKAKGLLARVLQHEVDHLNGALFIDKMVKYTKGEDKVKELENERRNKE